MHPGIGVGLFKSLHFVISEHVIIIDPHVVWLQVSLPFDQILKSASSAELPRIQNPLDLILFSIIHQIRWWLLILGPVHYCFVIGGEKISVEHWMNAPLHGKFQMVIDRGHHLNDLEKSMSSGHKLGHWLIKTEVAVAFWHTWPSQLEHLWGATTSTMHNCSISRSFHYPSPSLLSCSEFVPRPSMAKSQLKYHSRPLRTRPCSTTSYSQIVSYFWPHFCICMFISLCLYVSEWYSYSVWKTCPVALKISSCSCLFPLCACFSSFKSFTHLLWSCCPSSHSHSHHHWLSPQISTLIFLIGWLMNQPTNPLLLLISFH